MSIMRDWIVDQKEQADVDAERWLAHRPTCACCGEKIFEDYAYRIGDDLYCVACMNLQFKEDISEE